MYNYKIDTFLCAAEQSSFSKAAAVLHTTATTVMNHVRDLEKEIGAPLFERNPNGIVLTENGKVFYREVASFVERANTLIEHTRQKIQKQNRLVCLGTFHMNPIEELCRLWKRVPDKRNIQISLLTYPSSLNNAAASFYGMDSRVDILFSTEKDMADPKTISSLPVCSFPLTVAVPLTHPLAEKERLTLEDLDGESIVFPTRGNSEMYYRLSSAVKKEKKHPRFSTVPVFYDFDLYNRCAEENEIIISLSAWNSIHPGMVNLPVDWGKDWRLAYYLFWKKKSRPEVLDFIEAFKEGMEADRKEREG